MLENGYIKAFRALKRWGWYKDSTTKDIWLHILLSANYEPQTFKGRQIERGQLVTSYPSLSDETGLSIQNVRTAIKHLKQTGEIVMQSTKDYSIITVPKFDDYQSDAPTPNSLLTDNQQAANSQLTGCQQSTNRLLTTMKESKKARKQESKKEWSVPLPPDADKLYSQDLLSALTDWLTYKHERSEDYKPTGLRNLLSEIQNKAGEHGDKAVCDVIRLSMSNNWRGIIWDRLQATLPKKGDTGGHEQTGELQPWEQEWLAEVNARKAEREAQG